MINKFGQVIDCFEVFPTLEDFYDCMMDLLTEPEGVARLSAWVARTRRDLRDTGVDIAMMTLFTEGIEFSVTFVGRDYPEQANGTVCVFAYTLKDMR